MHALVIEGGGMKAAYANGVLSAFEKAGYAPWDYVVGSSAGGALAAWHGAGQAQFAEGTWKYAADPRILSYTRPLRGEPILDHAKLIDIVYAHEHPLDVRAVCVSPWPVVVTASSIDGRCVYQDLRKGQVLAWIKATGRLPLGSGPPVTIDGQAYLDGGILDPIPLRHALAQGADEVTLIVNTPPGPKKKDPRVFAELAGRRYPALRNGFVRHQQWKQEALDLAAATDVPVHVLRPQQPTGVHRLSRDMEAIRGAIDAGRRDGEQHIAITA